MLSGLHLKEILLIEYNNFRLPKTWLSLLGYVRSHGQSEMKGEKSLVALGVWEDTNIELVAFIFYYVA